jgi:uncharacterized protein (TIGR03084 family)
MADATTDVLTDLATEYSRLDGIFAALSTEQWGAPSGAPGWTVRDVVAHLAISEAGVATTLTSPSDVWTTRSGLLDDSVDRQVREDESSPDDVLARWRVATESSLTALRAADPTVRVRWAAAPLRPLTLATTRLAEHWAHGLDVCVPLGIAFPDTDRLRHIAWLGHATLPYALRGAGVEPFPVHCQLTAPSGARWNFGPADAAAVITGSAGLFCRVGARRLPGLSSGLATSNANAATALEHLRNYAT